MRRREGDKERDILDAATRIFCEQGYEGAKVAAIAAAASVGTGSIYLYFADKEAVLDGVFTRFWKRAKESMGMISEPDPSLFLSQQLGIVFDLLASDRELCTVYLNEHARFLKKAPSPGIDDFRSCVSLGELKFSEGVTQGVFDGQLSIPLARTVVFGTIRAALEFLVSQSWEHPADVRSQVLRMALAALRNKS